MTAEPRSATEATNGTVAGGGAGPLRGVKVLEITKYVQGPVAGLVLASLGAEVTKIELVGRQDAMRSIGAMHGVTLDERGSQWVYAAVNRNKRALALDVSDPMQRSHVESLFECAYPLYRALRRDARDRCRAYWAAHEERAWEAPRTDSGRTARGRPPSPFIGSGYVWAFQLVVFGSALLQQWACG